MLQIYYVPEQVGLDVIKEMNYSLIKNTQNFLHWKLVLESHQLNHLHMLKTNTYFIEEIIEVNVNLFQGLFHISGFPFIITLSTYLW